MASADILVYVKEECGLCEQLLEELNEYIEGLDLTRSGVKTDLRIEIRDIEDRPEWYKQYREYVPTVVVNDREVCHYFFDARELEEALECL